MRPDTRFVARACSLVLLLGVLAMSGPATAAYAQQQPSTSPTPAQEPSESPTPEPSPSCRPPVAPACVPSIGPSPSPSPTPTTEPTPSAASSAPAPASTRTATRAATSRPTAAESIEQVDVPDVPVGRATFTDAQSAPNTKAAKSSGDAKNVGGWLAVAIIAVILLGAGGGIGLYLTRETR